MIPNPAKPLLGLALLVFPGVIHAWTVDSVSAGHDGWFRRGRWIPVEVRATNGAAPFRGTLAVEVDGAIRSGIPIETAPGARVEQTFWVTAHTSRPVLTLVAISDGVEETVPLDCTLREAPGALIACLPGSLGGMSRTDWLSEIPRSPDLEVAAIDWDLKGWRRDVRALEVVDILLTPPEESGRRAWPPELLPGIEAWEGLGGRIETDPRVIDLSTWRGPVLDPGIAPSAVSCLPHEIWPAEWRMRGLRAVGILVLVCGVAAFLLRWQRASPALSALGMTAAGAVSVGLSTLVVPPSRATLDVMAVARIGTGARLQGMRLAGPVERLDWLRVAGVPGGSWSPVLPVDAPMRRLWLEPAAASRGPAGTIEGGAGATRWRPAMSTREAPATLEARSLSWEPLPITVARQASPGGAPRWVCTVHDPAFDGAERYLSDGQHIWAWTAGEEAEAAFEWPSPELAVSLWKFAERAQAAEEGEGGFRLRLVAAAVARTPPERRFMLAVPGRTFVERTQEGFLRVRVHPTLWMVEVPEK